MFIRPQPYTCLGIECWYPPAPTYQAREANKQLRTLAACTRTITYNVHRQNRTLTGAWAKARYRALRNLTRNNAELTQLALDAGAQPEWL